MDLATKDLIRRCMVAILVTLFASSIILIGLTIFIKSNNIHFFSVDGPSMEPTLHNKSILLLKESKDPIKGELILFDKPSTWETTTEGKAIFVKRLQAVPNDELDYNGKTLKINGNVVYNFSENNYECNAKPYKHKLTNNEYIVFGDNAKQSLDSRAVFCQYGPKEMYVPKSNIVAFGTIYKKL